MAWIIKTPETLRLIVCCGLFSIGEHKLPFKSQSDNHEIFEEGLQATLTVNEGLGEHASPPEV